MARERHSTKPGLMALVLLLVIASVCVSLVCVSCENLTTSSSDVSSAGEAVSPSSTESVVESGTQSATTQSSEASTVATTGDSTPDVLLDESDFGNQIRLHVGDRARVDLPAHPTAENGEVTSVEWTYSTGGIVQQIDAGTTTADGYVTACWLEVEAIATGNVTIRAIYVHENTTTRAKWVVYLAVGE